MSRNRPANEVIVVRGARANNLRGVDIDIPKHRLVVFTGVSGSGKSSLAFDTIAAESQRMLNETYPAFVQNLMPRLPRPDVDRLEHLSAAIVVDQAAMSGNPRSTVGTATDTLSGLRTLFARHGSPGVTGPRALSFNDPAGACPQCQGSGQRAVIEVDRILNASKSLNQGAISFPNFAVGSLFWKVYARSGDFDVDQPVKQFTKAQREHLLSGSGPSVQTGSHPMAYEGVVTKIQRLYLSKDLDALPARVREAVQRCATVGPCEQCGGSRLNAAARDCQIAGHSISDLCTMHASDLASWLSVLELPAPLRPVRAGVLAALEAMGQVGLGYLALQRPTSTLSGGEAQRIKTVMHLDSALSELTYVFDEPAAGLHPHDTARVIELLRRLRDKGNSVLVVEHQSDVVLAADHVIDLGPGAGSGGGHVVFEGTPKQLAASDTVTARHLNRHLPIKTDVREEAGTLRIERATRNNLQDVTVKIPLGCLVTVTGVAGAGKTSLLASLPAGDDVAVLDQSPIRGSRRSSCATYAGVLDDIRADFAAANDVKATMFSPNSDGACPECSGLGVTWTANALGPEVATRRSTCDGRRFRADVLSHTLRGLSIAEVLDLSLEHAATFFAGSRTGETLSRLTAVGLGYLVLGQPVTQLSGGERQRLRLGIEMGRRASVYVLDEPTTGLHTADVHVLVGLFDSLVDSGTSLIVAEHHRDVIAQSDWVIDLGPDAGHGGGHVVFTGTPSQLEHARTHTGRALRATHT